MPRILTFRYAPWLRVLICAHSVFVEIVFVISLVENYSEAYPWFVILLAVGLGYVAMVYRHGRMVIGPDFLESRLFRVRRIYFRDVTDFSKSWIRPTLSSPDCSLIVGPDMERQEELLDAIEHRLRS